ncbi:MAG: YkgJ family cysteine cluster protein [Caldimicrobium sp.]
MLITLYEYLEETFSQFPIACIPGCNSCCTTRLYVTSLEAEYLFKGLKEEDILNLYNLKDFIYPRPSLSHNQIALLYYLGKEPSLFEEGEPSICPFLTSEGLCKVYERRPVICRILLSFEKCAPGKPAALSQELYLMGLIALQIVENIDVGGLYGNLFDLLKFYYELEKGTLEEIPSNLLSTVEFEELPLLPEEKNLRSWIGNLYRKKIKDDFTFRDLLDEIKNQFKAQKRLSFLEDIWSEDA